MRELAFSPASHHVNSGFCHSKRSSRVGLSGDMADNRLRPELGRVRLVRGGVDPIRTGVEAQCGKKVRAHIGLARTCMLQVMS